MGFLQQASGLGNQIGDFEGFYQIGNVVFLEEGSLIALLDAVGEGK